MYLILFLFYFIFVFTVEILKSGVSVSLSTCVCDRARVCVRVCERVSFVLSFYQKHTRQINQMSQRDETGRRHSSSCPPLSATVAVVADDDELSLAQYVLCVCVCIVQAASLLRSTAANFQGRVLLPPLPLCHYLLLLMAHTHYTHTTTTAVYVPMCVCKAINLMIY